MTDVTCGIATKNRYELLALTLLSVAQQIVKPGSVIIIDDSDEPKDLRDLPIFQSVFYLFNEYRIGWQVVFGKKLGQHYSHQQVQEMARTKYVWRIDDDEIAGVTVLQKLLWRMKPNVGAVGGLVLSPSHCHVPENAANLISDLDRPNLQWFSHPTIKTIEVEHLHSTFLYRKGIANYELSLSPAAFREETLFTYELIRKGYKLILDTGIITWHFPSPTGGIRSHNDPGFWNHDENVFAQQLLDWGVVKPRPEKIIVLDAGRGDHLIARKLLPKIKKRYPDVLIASCFPDILDGEVNQISIAEARKNLGNLENHSIYGWCQANNWTRNLVEAFEKMYDLG